ncbi:MAG: Dephospho-CoA kinase, partial [uncultured bacterium]
NVKAPYCICVIPLLAESSGIDFIHRVLVVTSGKQLQLNRATKRDVASAESIENIMASQSSHEDRIKIANDVIENNGDLAQLEKKVAELHERYLKLYSAS